MSKAMVVAHPDDETMWGAGIILADPGDWTVICCSIPRIDPIRAYKFYEACEVLGAKGKVYPYEESDPHNLLNLNLTLDFDTVVTHNKKGEYGHLHHLQVSRYVREHFNGNLIYFGHGIDGEPVEYDQNKKLEALRCYDHMTNYKGKQTPKWVALLDRYGEVRDTYVSAG